MSEWIDQQLYRLNNPNEPLGKRLYSIVEETANQRDVLASFKQNAIFDVPGEAFAKRYLAELEKTRDGLMAEAIKLRQDPESSIVYWSVQTAIERERAGYVPLPIDLVALYDEFKKKHFDETVPALSEGFICTFSRLPFDAAGICYLEKDASRLGIRQGIRINEKLREFPAEAKAALLHEMVHATGIRKHDIDFRSALLELFKKGAYLDPKDPVL